MQMHTIHERNYTVMKLPRNGTSMVKTVNRKTIWFIEATNRRLVVQNLKMA